MPLGDNPRIALDIVKLLRDNISAAYYIPWIEPPSDPRMREIQVIKLDAQRQLVLGPALGRIQSEYLDPVIRLTANWLMMIGAVEPPPNGAGFEIEYVSPLVRGQKLSEVNAAAQWVELVGMLSQDRPFSGRCGGYRSACRATPRAVAGRQRAHGIRSPEHVAAIREKRAARHAETGRSRKPSVIKARAAQSIAQARQSSEGGRPRGS